MKTFNKLYCAVLCSVTELSLPLNVLSFLLIFREYEDELQTLSGVRDELEKVSSDKITLQKEFCNLEGKYKVMETLRDSQETELQTLKVSFLLLLLVLPV